MPIYKTQGINIAPRFTASAGSDGRLLSRIESAEALTYEMSTLHLGMSLTAHLANGSEVPMYASIQTCGSGCHRKDSGLVTEAVGGEAQGQDAVEIVRFAKFGRVIFQGTGLTRSAIRLLNVFRAKPLGADWLVHMEDGHVLGGTLDRRSLPWKLSMGGKMVLTVLPDIERHPRC